MSNEMTPREAMAEAVRLLRDAADELHESHNAPGETTFDGEPEAQAAYEEHERVANALESAIAALAQDRAAQATDDRFPGGLADAIEYVNAMEEGAGWAYAILFGMEDDGSKTGTELMEAVIAQLRASQGAEAGSVMDFWVCPDCEHYYQTDGVICDCHGRSTQSRMRHIRMVSVAAAPSAPTQGAEREVG